MILYTQMTNGFFLFEEIISRNWLNGLQIYGAHGTCKVIILTY